MNPCMHVPSVSLREMMHCLYVVDSTRTLPLPADHDRRQIVPSVSLCEMMHRLVVVDSTRTLPLPADHHRSQIGTLGLMSETQLYKYSVINTLRL